MRNAPILLALFLLGCPKTTQRPDRPDPSPPPPAVGRAPAVAKDHPLYARVEGTSFANDCSSDDKCVTGGCSAEVCSAEQVTTTCEFPEGGFPSGEGCGCVDGQCVWYNSSSSAALPKQSEKCPDGKCAEGLTCIEYYGVAGPSGPKFTSCEIPCPDEKSTCPEGQGCTTIADGPGRVCRPAN